MIGQGAFDGVVSICGFVLQLLVFEMFEFPKDPSLHLQDPPRVWALRWHYPPWKYNDQHILVGKHIGKTWEE